MTEKLPESLAMKLTPENYTGGLLVDNQMMGGVSEHPEKEGEYVAFMIDHTSGDYVAFEAFPTLEKALETVNSSDRAWKFEKINECSGHSHEGEEHGAGGCGGCSGSCGH